jgi:charged multivesicular body protein 3
MDEMLDETMEGMDEEEDLEEEAQDEVDKILFQITDGKLGQNVGAVGALPAVRLQSSLTRNSC